MSSDSMISAVPVSSPAPPRARARRIKAAIFLSAALILSCAETASVAAAEPTYPAMNAAGGVYWRSAPDWSTPVAEAGNGYYEGSVLSVQCYQPGTAVPGSADTMWERATVVAGPGHGSGWVNEHFINDGSAIDQPSPGVGPCQPGSPPPPPAGGGGLVFSVVNADGGIYYRNSPHWSDSSQVAGVGVFNGDSVELVCGAFGDPVGPYANGAWSYLRNLTRPGIGNGWVNEHFIDDRAAAGQLAAGEPACDASIPGATGPGATPGAGAAPAPVAQSHGCAPFMVIDSRGSGEPFPMISPPGRAFAAEFARRHHPARVAVIANPYPAVGLWGSLGQFLNLLGAGLGIGPLGAYHGSVVDGERWLSTTIRSEVSSCPTTKLLLSGYSQGAQVTGDVFQRAVSAGARTHIVAVVLFGDPYFNPSDSRADHGSFLSNKSGVLGARASFGGDRRVISTCHMHDPVCQRPSNVVQAAYYGFAQHENYPPDGITVARHF